jgi:outer membrane lipoprotein-sorting protein
VKRALRAVTLAALACWLCGCPVPLLRSGPELPVLTDLNTVARAFTLRDAAVTSLRTRLRVRVQQEGLKPLSTTVLVTVKRPGAVRIETLGPLDELEGLFVLKDGRYTAVSMPDRRAKRGAAGPAAFEEALGLTLSPDEAEALLCGAFKIVDFTQGQIGFDEKEKEAVVLIEKPGDRKQIVRADRETLAVRKVETFDAEGIMLHTVEFGDISPVMGVPFAHRFKASFPGRVRSVDVKYREIELNPAVGDDEFVVEVPQGFAVE